MKIVLKETPKDIQEKYKTLSEYANEYFDENLIKRVKAVHEEHEQILWKMVYDEIMKWENTAEFEAWYIFCLKEKNNLPL